MCLKIGEFVLLMIWACMGAGKGVAMPVMDNLLSRYSWHQSNACSATLAWYDLHCAMCCPAQWLAGRRGKHKAMSAMTKLLGRGIWILLCIYAIQHLPGIICIVLCIVQLKGAGKRGTCN